MKTDEQLENELEMLKEKFEMLKGQVDLIEIILKQSGTAPSNVPQGTPLESPGEKITEVIQINTKDGKRYFCQTNEQQQIFDENNPGAKKESFHIKLQDSTARKYLEDPENIKQFTRKES